MTVKAAKQTKAQRIAQLERQLIEAQSGQAHVYHFSSHSINKASVDNFMGSGVIITIKALGGREIVGPTLIRDGLTERTIRALQDEFKRSFDLATQFKPVETAAAASSCSPTA